MKRTSKDFYGLLVICFLSLAIFAGCPGPAPDTTASTDTTAPINTTASNFINSGASSASSTAVTLAISATDSVGVTGYYASETSTAPSASASGWIAVASTTSYSANVSFTLSSGDAAKTLYVWFKDAAGNVSASVNDSITLAATLSSKLVGTWGEVTLQHNNDGTWDTEVCKFTYNSDNTGTGGTCQSNYGGTLGTDPVVTVTYSVVSNPDGSLTLNKTFPDGTLKTHRWVIGDDGNVMILDGTTNNNRQRFRVAVKLDTAKTYTNADLSGDYYFERYMYDGSYNARSGIETFDGVGNRSVSRTDNTNGSISTSTGTGTYSLNSDGSFTLDSGAKGYLTGDGEFGSDVRVTTSNVWSLALSMKKGDKTYSTADLAGTWAWADFGDDYSTGTNKFFAQFGTLTCDGSGSCTWSIKVVGSDGTTNYVSNTDSITVAADGSLGSLPGPDWGAIGNNGNTMTLSGNFDPATHGSYRHMAVAVKCSSCSNLAGTGASIGAAFPIANTSRREMSIGAAFDGTNFLVGIQDATFTTPSNPYTSNITAQLVSKTGTLVGSSISTGGTGGAPAVAFDGTNYLLAWEGEGTYTTFNAGQFVSASGTLVGPQFTFATGTDMRMFSGNSIIFDGTNYFVAWRNRSTADNGDTSDVFGQFITPSGATLGSVVSISTAAHGQREPSLAFDGANILAVWPDGRNQSACEPLVPPQTTPSCYESDVYGQFITKSSASAAGPLSGSNFLISAGTLPRDNFTGIGFDGTNYLVTFVEETTFPNACPSSGCNWEAYGILVTKTGSTTGSKFVIGNTTTSQKIFPLPTYLGTKYLVTWIDGFGTTSASVKGQYVTTSGTSDGSEFTLFSPASSGAVPSSCKVFTGGGVNLAVSNWGIPDVTDPSNMDLYTSADVMGSIITTP